MNCNDNENRKDSSCSSCNSSSCDNNSDKDLIKIESKDIIRISTNLLLDQNIDDIEINDNRKELFEKFYPVFDFKRFSMGYQWFCSKCHSPCSSSEIWFSCKNSFVTIKVICHLGCHNHWRFKINCMDNNEKFLVKCHH